MLENFKKMLPLLSQLLLEARIVLRDTVLHRVTIEHIGG